MLTSMANELAVPGISTQYNQDTIEILFGRAEMALFTPGLLSGAARDSGNTPTTLLRAGLLLGKITSSGKLVQASPTATDGSQNIVGVLPIDMNAQLMATNEDRYLPVLTKGCVKAASLLIGGNASRGIAGDAYEYWVRAQMSPNFTFDDASPKANAIGPWQRVEYVTADRTVVAADHGTLFICQGGSANVNFTLPAMLHGYAFGFYNAQDYNMTITSAPADTLIVYNDAAADSVALSTTSEKIGGGFNVYGTSTSGKAIVIPQLWEGQTPTIAT